MSDENDELKVYRAKLSDFHQMRENPNKHTERGQYALETSVEEVGYLDSMVASDDGELISGNLRSEIAGEKLGDEVIVVETDGRTAIIHKRTDLQSNDARAKLAAIAANRVAEVSLQWDAEILEALALDDAIDLGQFFHEDELADMFNAVPSLDELAAQYGEPDDADFWPVIRAKVAPDLYEAYQRITAEFGSDDDERMAGLLRAYLSRE